MRLTDSVAVVTGGARGLGRSITMRLAAEGASVVCAGRDEAAAADLVSTGGGKVRFHPVDVRQPESVQKLFGHVAGAFGRLDILVANAGVSQPGRIEAVSAAGWQDVFHTHVSGTFHCIQAATGLLRGSGGGRIVTLSSALSAGAVPGASAYCASKAAVEKLTTVAAVELAVDNITVNCVAPGFIDEGMGRELASNEAVWPQYRTKLSGHRMGTGDEVAAAVAFLVSPDAAYVNGHVLHVNGGLRW